MIAIQIRNLTKRFKNLIAVDNINLEIAESECFGLLGPNGAGKTSLVRMITGVSPPTGGEIWVLGKDLKTRPQEIKACLGVSPQIDNLDPDLTVLENLMVFARYFDIPRAEARRRSMEVLELFELKSKLNNEMKELSGGMKRRLILARALINKPQILVLDEPTTGLDPQTKYLVWHKLTELKTQGVTQVLCTQNMDEARKLCDRVAIMNLGKVLTLDTPEHLIVRHAGKEVWEIGVSQDKKPAALAELKSRGLDFEDTGEKIHIFHTDSEEPLSRLRDLTTSFSRRPATLEDVFFRITGRSLVE